MNLFLVFIYTLNLTALSWLVYKAYLVLGKNPLKNYYLPALLFKVASGIALGLLYSFYYNGGDTFLFFEKAKDLLALPVDQYLNEIFLTSIPHEERSVLPMTKITSLILVLTGKNYWLATLYFSLFSFAGTFYFLIALSTKYPEVRKSAVLAFLFFPSVVFWSSGILKESIVFGIMMFMLGFLFWYLVLC
jgi:hypothetical protein